MTGTPPLGEIHHLVDLRRERLPQRPAEDSRVVREHHHGSPVDGAPAGNDAVPGERLHSMPNPWARCRTKLSISTKLPGSNRRSIRSRAVRLPLARCRRCALGSTSCSACERRSARSSTCCCIVRGTQGWGVVRSGGGGAKSTCGWRPEQAKVKAGAHETRPGDIGARRGALARSWQTPGGRLPRVTCSGTPAVTRRRAGVATHTVQRCPPQPQIHPAGLHLPDVAVPANPARRAAGPPPTSSRAAPRPSGPQPRRLPRRARRSPPRPSTCGPRPGSTSRKASERRPSGIA